MIEAKDRGHNFSKLWSANFPFIFYRKGLLDIVFCQVFHDNSKIVVSKIMNVILKFYTLVAVLITFCSGIVVTNN